MGKASFWEPAGDLAVRCLLCPHGCVISDGGTGICRVRENRGGTLYSTNYGRVSSVAVDPVEKKPLYHVDPGGLLLSAGSFGCNLGCQFCQNWQISQEMPRTQIMSPSDLVRTAKRAHEANPEMTGIAYTYNEPIVWIEHVLEVAQEAKDAGLRNVLVTNGYVSQEPLARILGVMDALNVDVKGWTEDFYRRIIRGKLAPVLRTIEAAVEKAWVEVTYLVIPDENDSDLDVGGLSKFLGSLSPSIPLHLSRYFPNYKMGGIPTPVATLTRLRDVAREHLDYVYIGNVVKAGFADTFCAGCGERLLSRGSLDLKRSWLGPSGTCPTCGKTLPMLGKVFV